MWFIWGKLPGPFYTQDLRCSRPWGERLAMPNYRGPWIGGLIITVMAFGLHSIRMHVGCVFCRRVICIVIQQQLLYSLSKYLASQGQHMHGCSIHIERCNCDCDCILTMQKYIVHIYIYTHAYQGLQSALQACWWAQSMGMFIITSPL